MDYGNTSADTSVYRQVSMKQTFALISVALPIYCMQVYVLFYQNKVTETQDFIFWCKINSKLFLIEYWSCVLFCGFFFFLFPRLKPKKSEHRGGENSPQVIMHMVNK